MSSLREVLSKTKERDFSIAARISWSIWSVSLLKTLRTFNSFCNYISRFLSRLNNSLTWLTSFRTCVISSAKQLLFFKAVSYLFLFNSFDKFIIKSMTSSRCSLKKINISRNWTTLFLIQNLSCSALLMSQTKVISSTPVKTSINKRVIRREITWFYKKATRVLISKKLFSWLAAV